MLFAPIGFTTMKGSWDIMFLSDMEYPGILYAILLLDFSCSVEIINRRFVSDRNLKIYRLIAENGAYPPNQNGLIHPQLSLKWA